MSEKEIIDVLAQEEELEAKLAKAKLQAEKIPQKALEKSQKQAERLKKEAQDKLLASKMAITKEVDLECKGISERSEKTIAVINSCHDNISGLAKRTIKDLLGELTE